MEGREAEIDVAQSYSQRDKVGHIIVRIWYSLEMTLYVCQWLICRAIDGRFYGRANDTIYDRVLRSRLHNFSFTGATAQSFSMSL